MAPALPYSHSLTQERKLTEREAESIQGTSLPSSLGVRASGLVMGVWIVEDAGEDRGEGLRREGDSHRIPGWERQGLQLH